MSHVKQPDTTTPAEPVTGAREPSTEICPYCHKLLDDENLLCRLTHEHGKFGMPREHHPLYSELEDALSRANGLLAEAADEANRLQDRIDQFEAERKDRAP